MAFDRYLIAPLNTGLQLNMRPWLIMDDAFEQLQNAYVFRGRVKKRFGSDLMEGDILKSRLRMSVGTTDASGNLTAVTLPGTVLNAGAMFSVGNVQFTVTTVPVTVGSVATLSTQAPTVGTITLVSTGPNVYQFSISGSYTTIASTPVYWYPALPVMGLTQYERGAINNHPSYAFDTQFAYVYVPQFGWERSGNVIWTGNTLNYFWTANWDGITPNVVTMFVSNFNQGDPIYATQDGSTWNNFSAVTVFLTAGNYVQTARIILPFKNRLILLDTIETDGTTYTNYKNRCRYSHNGSPFATNAWLEPNQTTGGQVADGAGFIDATTEEEIISAEFIKDRLIVYFERSTWELAYTGNEVLPFVWQKLNTELGSQSTFSTVPFDTNILTIGNTGVHACNGSNVQRIDSKIPNIIFDFKVENDEQARTCGIRDYQQETVYWSYMNNSTTNTQNFPNQVLVYNYQNGSWAINDDCFTAFGYFEQQLDSVWATSNITWQEANFTWISGLREAQQRVILAGTPNGFVVTLDPNITRNAPSISIVNITIPSATLGVGYVDLNVINHNLNVSDYVALENSVGLSANNTIYQVYAVTDANNIILKAPDISGSYLGGGTLARVSNIRIRSKQWNPYVNQSRNVYLAKIDFGVEKTSDGQVTVDYSPSSTNISMIGEGIATNSILGNNILETSPYNPRYYPLEQYQERLWHTIYFQTYGECIQIYIYMSNDQISNMVSAWSPFVLEGILLHTQATDSRLQ